MTFQYYASNLGKVMEPVLLFRQIDITSRYIENELHMSDTRKGII
ncbi:hypothetical protein EMIT0210MI2_10998 [Priestia megaterium]